MRHSAVLIAALLCIFPVICRAANQATDIERKIDPGEAATLAALGAAHGAAKEDMVPAGPEVNFITFAGVSEIDTYGFFAVNPWTGDVWDLWDCRKLITPSLRRKQEEIRRQFSPTELKQYDRLRRLHPKCV